jgi:hypothetical protein
MGFLFNTDGGGGTGGGGGIPDAPSTGILYGRRNANWEPAATPLDIDDLQVQIDALAAGLVYVGAYNVATNFVTWTPSSGLVNGPLPPANAAGIGVGWYVICTTAGTGTGNAPAVAMNVGDQLISGGPTGGTAWSFLPVGRAVATADLVAMNPAVSGWTNVQLAIEGLNLRVAPPLLPATATVLGGVMIGANVNVLPDGTISVAPPGMADPTTTQGDLIVRGLAAPPTRLGVGTDGQVLTADSAQPLGMRWATPAAGGVSSVFTRTGAVVAVAGDYTAAQVTNAVSTLGAYADPPWITALAWAKITGAPTVSSYQTPWLSDINAANFNLNGVNAIGVGRTVTGPGTGMVIGIGSLNAVGVPLILATENTERMRVTADGNVGIGNPGIPPDPGVTARVHLVIGVTAVPSTRFGALELGVNTAAVGAQVGGIGFSNYAIAGVDKRIAGISGVTEGGIDSGALVFATSLAGAALERMRIVASGSVGIGVGAGAAPGGKLEVVTPGTLPALRLSRSGGANLLDFEIQNIAPFAIVIQGRDTGGAVYPLSLQAAGGSVGIGVQTPAATLEVFGPAASGIPELRLSRDGGTNILDIKLDSGGVFGASLQVRDSGTAATYPLILQPNGGGVMIPQLPSNLTGSGYLYYDTNQGAVGARVVLWNGP